jgi:hypothetical protein
LARLFGWPYKIRAKNVQKKQTVVFLRDYFGVRAGHVRRQSVRARGISSGYRQENIERELSPFDFRSTRSTTYFGCLFDVCDVHLINLTIFSH